MSYFNKVAGTFVAFVRVKVAIGIRDKRGGFPNVAVGDVVPERDEKMNETD